MTDSSRAIDEAVRRSHSGRETVWLDEVPSRVERCTEAWSLKLDSAMTSSSAIVLHGRRSDGDPVTLKLVRCRRDFESESLAMASLNGAASVRLIAADAADHAMLPERVLPGYSLRTLMRADGDEAATRAAANVVVQLHASRLAADSGSRLEHIGAEASATLDRYRRRYGSGSAVPISSSRIRNASSLIHDLRAAEDETVVLHGDLHHDNLRRGARAPWIAIDPKGRVGDPAAELAAFIRNPIDQLAQTPDLRAFLRRRIDQLVEAIGYDRARVIGWAFSLAVVGACWQLEDRESDWNRWLAVAGALA